MKSKPFQWKGGSDKKIYGVPLIVIQGDDLNVV